MHVKLHVIAHCGNLTRPSIHPLGLSGQNFLYTPTAMSSELCPPYAPFFGFAGVASAVSGHLSIFFVLFRSLLCIDVADDIQQYVQVVYPFRLRSFGHVAVGAAFGTAKSGIGIAGLGTFKPELIMKASPNSRIIIPGDPAE